MFVRPITHRLGVNIDQNADVVATISKGHDLVDVRRELEFVLHDLGRKQRTVLERANILHPVDNVQLTVLVQPASVTGVEPAIGVGGALRALHIIVVTQEETRRTHQHFALGTECKLHSGCSRAHGTRLDPAFGLRGNEQARLGRAIELLQVDTHRTVKKQQVRAGRFPR